MKPGIFVSGTLDPWNLFVPLFMATSQDVSCDAQEYKDGNVKGWKMEMWKFVILSLWLGILAVLDLWWKKVPVWLLVVGGIIMTFMSAYQYARGIKGPSELVWGLVPGVLLLLIAVTSKKAGIADGIVFLLLSLPLDYRECIISFVLSFLIMSFMSLLLLVLNKVKGNSKLPYLPFLLAGYMVQAIAGLG